MGREKEIRTCIHSTPCVAAGIERGVHRGVVGGDILGGYAAGPLCSLILGGIRPRRSLQWFIVSECIGRCYLRVALGYQCYLKKKARGELSVEGGKARQGFLRISLQELGILGKRSTSPSI